MVHHKFQDHETCDFWFLRRFLNVLAMYKHGGHFGHVIKFIFINLCPLFQSRPHIKFGFD